MTLKEFIADPWKNEHLHGTYKSSFLAFSNAPEYGPSEMLLASLYRRIGLRQCASAGTGSGNPLPESAVGKLGTALKRSIEKSSTKGNSKASISVEGWQRVIEDVIRSPKTPNQGKSNFVQTTPLVPSAAIYSMAARLRGNPWNPGALIESCLCFGGATNKATTDLWKSLFAALSVKKSKDDIWAVFLEREYAKWNQSDVKWRFDGKTTYPDWMESWQGDKIQCPARRFARDLQHVIAAKAFLTRRQWTSVVESVLRMGLGAHVLWITKVNHELFSLAEAVLRGGQVPTKDEIRNRLSTGEGFWSYGQLTGVHIKKLIRNYMYGRIGINMLLYRSQELQELKGLVTQDLFSSVGATHGFLCSLSEHREVFDMPQFEEDLDSALDTDPRKVAIKHGTGKNLEEFLRHVLGQRQTQERGLEGYDQGYLLSRKGAYSRAPWILAAGPVMILTLVYACTRDGSGIRTVEDLCKHLGEYGIKINPDEVADTKLGRSLRTLGLVLDSPDAEGGMVLLDPFGAHLHSNRVS